MHSGLTSFGIVAAADGGFSAVEGEAATAGAASDEVSRKAVTRDRVVLFKSMMFPLVFTRCRWVRFHEMRKRRRLPVAQVAEMGEG